MYIRDINNKLYVIYVSDVHVAYKYNFAADGLSTQIP